jgi:hypothetical protein
MKRHHYLVPLLLSVTLAACRSAGDPAPRAVELNQDIQLAAGERAVFGPEQLDLAFVRVVEDSRCPSDTTCVWAGEVKVQLSTRTGAAQAVSHEVVAGQQAAIGEWRVLVVQVRPERLSTRAIAPEEYKVTLRVERVTPI